MECGVGSRRLSSLSRFNLLNDGELVLCSLAFVTFQHFKGVPVPKGKDYRMKASVISPCWSSCISSNKILLNSAGFDSIAYTKRLRESQPSLVKVEPWAILAYRRSFMMYASPWRVILIWLTAATTIAVIAGCGCLHMPKNKKKNWLSMK